MKRILATLLISLALSRCAFAATGDEQAQALIDAFVAEYPSLHVPDFQMSHVENFKNIPDAAALEKQRLFFAKVASQLAALDRKSMSPDVRYQCDALAYETKFQIDRITLQREHAPTAAIGADGLFNVPNGRAWYELYIRRWGARDITPAQLLVLGTAEVARVKGNIRAIQDRLGYAGRDAEFYRHLNQPGFTITDESALQKSLVLLRDSVTANLRADFESTRVAAVAIQPVEKPTKDTPPGYYDAGTFYYTFFESRFPRRSMEWLYLHEADPGHHYQTQVSAERTPLLKLFWYPGFSEGWGAYAEDLGRDLGCYKDPYMELGKWEWDLVRSARVVLDVKIHYEGWTRDMALQWWQENVPNQQAVAAREVDRIIRWPAQVVSYKVGERTLLDLRARCEQRAGGEFDLRRFHTAVLKRGSVPLPVLEEIVNDALQAGAFNSKR